MLGLVVMEGVAEGLLLDVLGFKEGQIYETIVTTVDRDGSVNTAPMGVVRTGREALEVRPYRSSSTYVNLSYRPEACVNVTDDPSLFMVTAFKGEGFKGFEEPSTEGMRLKDANAHIFVTVQDQDGSEERGCFICRVDSVELSEAGPRAFNRGRAQAIEAVIHATRIKHLYGEGRVEEGEALVSRFAVCKEVVGKVSTSDSTEMQVIKEIDRLIQAWREKA